MKKALNLTQRRRKPKKKTLTVSQQKIPYEQELGNLLAVIHSDGGHYISEHGWTKALEDAEAIVLADRMTTDECRRHKCPSPIVNFMQGDLYVPRHIALDQNNVLLKGIEVTSERVIVQVEIRNDMKGRYDKTDAYSKVRV